MKYDKHGNPVAETDQDRTAIASGTARCKDGSLFTSTRTRRQKIEGMLYRDATVRAEGGIDEEHRLVHISMSSELPILRRAFFSDPWIETLGHKRGEVDLTRLNNGASVHYNHSRKREDRIGVVESAKLVTKKGGSRAAGSNEKQRRVEGVVRISKREDVDDIWTDIKDGVLRNVSVGYSVNERKLTRAGKDGEPDEFRITSWQIAEVSFVDIPADPTVGVGRNEQGVLAYRVIDLEPEKETNQMKFRYDENGNPLADTPETRAAILAGTATRKDGSLYVLSDEARALLTAAPAPVATPAPVVSIDVDAERTTAKTEGHAEGVAAEQTRVKDINAIFEPFGDTHDAIRTAAIADPEQTVEDVRQKLLTELGKDSTPGQTGDALRIESGEQGSEKFVRGAGLALAMRAGTISDEDRKAFDNSFGGFSLVELARHALAIGNINSSQMSRMELVGRAFTSSDFPLILANQANKSMLKGYDEAPETWNIWAQTGNLSDFKIASRVNLSTFNNLDEVSEDGEYKYGQFSEENQTIQLATFGKLFSISRQAIINDDLGMFTRIPASMGRAASRTVGNLAYGVITSNPLLSDGVALFAAGHNNLNLSGAGGTPLTADAAGTATLGTMRNGMGLQTDIGANAVGLNIRPGFLLVPLALEDTAKALMTDTTAPGQANPGVRNQLVNMAQVVSDPRLDADSVTRYYLAATQQWDTIEVAFLDGNQAPTLEQQIGWSIDGTDFKVRIDIAAAPMDFRTWQRDDGT